MAASALGMYSSRGRVLPGGRRRARLATGCPVRCCSCSSDRFRASASSSSSSSCRHHTAAPVMPAAWQGLQGCCLTAAQSAALTRRTQQLIEGIMRGLCNTVSGSAQSSLGIAWRRHTPQACCIPSMRPRAGCSALRLRHSQCWSKHAVAATYLHEAPAFPLRGRLLCAPGLSLQLEPRCSLVCFLLLLLRLGLRISPERVTQSMKASQQGATPLCSGSNAPHTLAISLLWQQCLHAPNLQGVA